MSSAFSVAIINASVAEKIMSKTKLSKLLSKQVVLADGAMGTMLYQSGVYINACFDELNLSNPKLVTKIHKQYAEAGVDFIETNTFGSNEVKLAKYGLAEQTEKINKAGVELAKKIAGDNILVAGAMGPLARDIALYNQISKQQAINAYKKQAKGAGRQRCGFPHSRNLLEYR